ncbi:glycosyl transferase [Prevotella sp. PINT]|jgi:Mannosyltransferase OCH1 and related enzymes|nr:glycosyl transferase [Palleniella intestinalis]
MIPKIIHYCWFGKADKPQSVLYYIATWKKNLPDYEIREWNETNFDYRQWKFCREAYAVRKYAFVADVCRMYALVSVGGIYLDTDIEVVSSFNPFLNHQSFIGLEDEGKLNTGCIAAEANTPWAKGFLESYKKRCFINPKGRHLSWPNSYLLKLYLDKSDSKPIVYPLDYFCAKHYTSRKLAVTKNTVCIHHYEGTWLNEKLTIIERLKNLYKKFTC